MVLLCCRFKSQSRMNPIIQEPHDPNRKCTALSMEQCYRSDLDLINRSLNDGS